jgi:hypothetical protein
MLMMLMGCFFVVPVSSSAEEVIVKLRNDSGEIVSVHWMHPQTKEAVLLSQVQPNVTYTLNSYYQHEFQIHQEPNEETGLCAGATYGDETNTAAAEGECKMNYFAVQHHRQQCKYSIEWSVSG